jgi:hypothetical protein
MMPTPYYADDLVTIYHGARSRSGTARSPLGGAPRKSCAYLLPTPPPTAAAMVSTKRSGLPHELGIWT